MSNFCGEFKLYQMIILNLSSSLYLIINMSGYNLPFPRLNDKMASVCVNIVTMSNKELLHNIRSTPLFFDVKYSAYLPMGPKILYATVAWCHQLLSEFLASDHLLRMSHQSRLSANDKGDN